MTPACRPTGTPEEVEAIIQRETAAPKGVSAADHPMRNWYHCVCGTWHRTDRNAAG